VQLADPKAALLLFALHPQFMPSGGHLLEGTTLLASLQVSVEAALHLAFTAAVGELPRGSNGRRSVDVWTQRVALS
jgi:threonine/homoserine/homoserine lactone efflux protein